MYFKQLLQYLGLTTEFNLSLKYMCYECNQVLMLFLRSKLNILIIQSKGSFFVMSFS